MAILIKGMEMPKSCYFCPLKKREGINIVCPVVQERFSVADVNILFYRLDSCQLVEIPEPHGRLIDADAMIRDIEKSLAPSWYIKERNADMVKFLSLEDTVIPASGSEERPAFLPTYELTPRKTNADRLRAMTDEELAEFLGDNDSNFPIGDHKKEWLDWLKQEIKE